MNECLETITNCRFDTLTFRQASLPVKFGGFGIRCLEDVSLPAFIASSKTCSSIVEHIISKSDSTYYKDLMSEAIMTLRNIDPSLVERLPLPLFARKVGISQLLNWSSQTSLKRRLTQLLEVAFLQ